MNSLLRRCLFLLLLALASRPVVAEPTPADLEAQVRRWLAQRQAWREMKQAWQHEQAVLADEERLLAARRDQIRRELDAASAAQEAAATASDTVASQADQAAQALTPIAEALPPVLANLRALAPQLPPPWQERYAAALDAIPPAAPDNLAERVQLTLEAFALLQELNRERHVAGMLLPAAGGRERQGDVLFLGLAIGYAVTRDGTMAAIGTPIPEGWHWQLQPAIAPAVRRAIAIVREEAPASLVTLPVRIDGKGDGQ